MMHTQSAFYYTCDICGKREDDEALISEFEVKNISPNGDGRKKTFHAGMCCAGEVTPRKLFKYVARLFRNQNE